MTEICLPADRQLTMTFYYNDPIKSILKGRIIRATRHGDKRRRLQYGKPA